MVWVAEAVVVVPVQQPLVVQAEVVVQQIFLIVPLTVQIMPQLQPAG